MNNEFGRVRIIKEWNCWNNDIHCEEKQIERQGRSLHYPFTFKINEKNMSGIFSSTTDIAYYETTLSSCTCYDFTERQLPCKHIYRLAVELGIIEIFNRPHKFDRETLDKVRVSSDIDNEPEQIKRQNSAMTPTCKPVEIDFENKIASFKGSGKSPYQTTPTSCTCRDFIIRRLPCKHIYRLRYELDNWQ